MERADGHSFRNFRRHVSGSAYPTS